LTVVSVQKTVAAWPNATSRRALGSRITAMRAPFASTALLLLARIFAVAPLRDAQTGIAHGRLRLPPLYVVFGPVCAILDAMSALSVRQQVAVVMTVLVYYASRLARRRHTWPSPRRALAVEVPRAVIVLLAIVGVYAFGALVDRPMAAYEASNPNEVVVDFHSHTSASWDGRRSFSAEKNRAWHRAAGFDVAYVSDHLPPSNAIVPLPPNPQASGAGTVLLPAFELGCRGVHVIVLGATPAEARGHCRERRSSGGDRPPTVFGCDAPAVFIATLPSPIQNIARADISAVEVVDGAPRAIDQIARDKDKVIGLAERRGLGLVAGSNVHGWGRTVVAWTVMEMPGWRGSTPEELDARIRARLSGPPDGTVHVVERRRTGVGQSTVSLVSTLPDAAWDLLVVLSPRERLSWVVWVWLVWLAQRAGRRLTDVAGTH
jgi:hypothetical protein